MEISRAELTIRPARQDEIVLLQRVFLQGGAAKHEERFERQEQGKVTYLIAWHGGQPVGHGLVKWQRPEDDLIEPLLQDACPDIEDLFVLEELRSGGIGSRILNTAEELARQRGYRQIGLSVDIEEGDRARKLYERLGYQDAGFGEFLERYEYVDEEGRNHLWEEFCIYLIKSL